jgi:hypothetical protein
MFKVGDRVYRVGDSMRSSGLPVGEKGVIRRVDADDETADVAWDKDGLTLWSHVSDLCLISSKEDTMNLMVTKEKVLEASKASEEGKKILQVMFPEAFEPEVKDITDEVTFEVGRACGGIFIKVLHKGVVIREMGLVGPTPYKSYAYSLDAVKDDKDCFRVFKKED